jgi:hypothetical protein
VELSVGGLGFHLQDGVVGGVGSGEDDIQMAKQYMKKVPPYLSQGKCK